MSQYCIFRAAKLQRGHGKQSIGKAIRHLDKHLESADISRPERTHLNKSRVFYKNIASEVNDAILLHNFMSDKKLRSDAAVAFEMIFTYSPEMEGKVSAQEFFNVVREFCLDEFKGAKTLRVDFHADETVSHFHVIMLATTPEQKISARQHLGNKAHLSYLQDRFADRCEPLGLKRGKRYAGQKKKPTHTTLRAYKQQQIEEIKQLDAIKKKMADEVKNFDKDLSR